MRLANIVSLENSGPGPHLVQGGMAYPLDACYAGEAGAASRDWEPMLKHLSEHGAPRGWDESSAVALSEAQFQAPITNQTRIICVGLNYRDHALEGKQEIPTHPVFFLRLPSSFVGHRQPLILPRASSKFDYEGELAVIIGRAAHHVSEQDALDHVFGYTAAMDGSLRDFQRRTPQWTLGKNFDRSGAIGPVIVSKDELPAGAAGLPIRTYVNDQLLQDGNTADMIFPIPRLIGELSQVMTLQPGDVILTGTPAGVGFARTPPVWLKHGDEVRVEIGSIPVLENTIEAEAA